MIKSLNVSRRRRFPYLQTDLEISAELALQGKLRGLFRSAFLLLSDEIPNLAETTLEDLKGTVLVNLRGRPCLTLLGESSEEIVVLLEGKRHEEEEVTPFFVSLVTRFLDFRGKDIRHELRYRAPADLDWEKKSFSELLALPEIEFERLTLSIERFVPRVFTFLGNRLPVLKETFTASLSSENRLELTLRDSDFQGQLSSQAMNHLEAVGQLGSDSTLRESIHQNIYDILNRK